ncbi:MAG TPA: septal ring lytic transglycosylase RlpA family protein [Solirubrobacterales bacterium]|nr:septal ring lytic transglycosylase RlpA family protein [Solirubrobacterales bacterium]
MRYLLSAAAAVTALSIGIAPATALDSSPEKPKRGAKRAKSHVSLHLSRHALLSGGEVVAHGRVRPGGRHRVKLVFRGPDRGVVETTTGHNGAFALRWAPSRSGNYAVRAFGVHDARARGSASAVRRLTAYRHAHASYYGPGLYGNGVACGGTLMPGTMGVAHKTLPCGTRVKLRYRGRTVTVPVIDRGPYVPGRDYDLTEAVKQRLGFPGIGTVLANR